jgi:enamine deaminase RidA (YjgF/YER057c/UK114 family)
MIPSAVRRGAYAFTSTLGGFDELVPALASVELTLDDVVQVGITVADAEYRSELGGPWRSLFGTSADAWPALRVTQMAMPPGIPIALQATAVAAEGRTSVALPGGNGARVGDLFVTASVNGRSRDGSLPENVQFEIAQALENVCALCTEAGGSSNDLLHFWAFATEGIVANDFTPSWIERFPRDGDRPARKTFLRAQLPGPERVTFIATARINGGRRVNQEVPWVQHSDPLPMAARIGNLFMTSGIIANPHDPNAPNGLGPLAETAAGQARDSFVNLEHLLRAQNGTLANVAQLGAVLPDYADLAMLEEAIAERFPAGALPALQIWSMPMASPAQRLQLFATALF